MSLSELQVFGLAAAAETILFFPLTCWYRCVNDQNGDGTIQVSEVPYIFETDNAPIVVKSPTMFDLSVISMARVFVESMMHSVCYGCLVVFGMNWAMPNADRRYAYIITTVMIFMGCCFMCRYATNGIHVVTSHAVHFLYYGFGHFALFFFQWIPETSSYLVAVYAVFRLVVYFVARSWALPNYPEPGQLLRLYKLDNTTGEWILGSAPKDCLAHDAQGNPMRRRSVVWGGNLPDEIPTPPYGELHKWAVTFPAYEIFNTNLSSSYAWGVCTGAIVCNVVDATGFAEKVSDISLGLSVLVSIVVVGITQMVGLYGGAERRMHALVLAKFWPQSSAMLLAALGGSSVVFNLGTGDASESSDLVVWASRGSFIAAAVFTYGFAFLAFKGHSKYNRVSTTSTA